MSIVVTPKDQYEPIERLLRRFKNKMKSENVLEDIKKHERFEKPSAAKRRKSIEAKRK